LRKEASEIGSGIQLFLRIEVFGVFAAVVLAEGVDPQTDEAHQGGSRDDSGGRIHLLMTERAELRKGVGFACGESFLGCIRQLPSSFWKSMAGGVAEKAADIVAQMPQILAYAGEQGGCTLIGEW